MVKTASTSPRAASESLAVVRAVTIGREVTDAELVERAHRGNSWAEEMLYRRYAPQLLSVCTRLLRHSADAEDVVHDAFVDALDQLGTLREASLFRSWIMGIAVHKVHRRLRRRKLLRVLGLLREEPDATIEACLAPGISPEIHAELVCLDQQLAQLPDAQRIAWQLRYVEGYRLEEVAEACRCSLATIKRRLQSADALLRKHIELEEAPHA